MFLLFLLSLFTLCKWAWYLAEKGRKHGESTRRKIQFSTLSPDADEGCAVEDVVGELIQIFYSCFTRAVFVVFVFIFLIGIQFFSVYEGGTFFSMSPFKWRLCQPLLAVSVRHLKRLPVTFCICRERCLFHTHSWFLTLSSTSTYSHLHLPVLNLMLIV